MTLPPKTDPRNDPQICFSKCLEKVMSIMQLSFSKCLEKVMSLMRTSFSKCLQKHTNPHGTLVSQSALKK